jgi:hypothetical protein
MRRNRSIISALCCLILLGVLRTPAVAGLIHGLVQDAGTNAPMAAVAFTLFAVLSSFDAQPAGLPLRLVTASAFILGGVALAVLSPSRTPASD